MNIRKIIATTLIIILAFSLFSCEHGTFIPGNSSHDNDSHSDEQNQGQQEQAITYVYSVTQKVIHRSDCYHIDRMSEDYKTEYSGDISELLAKDYTICKDCLVPKEEKPDEDEEDTNKIAKEDATYVINSSSKKLHELDCYHVKSMEEKNIEYTDLTLEELFELKYIPCGFCMPEEYEEYEKNLSEE